MTSMNREPVSGSQIAMFVVMAFVLGIGCVWLYAAVRPRFGAGPKTAVVAGVAAWFLVVLIPVAGMGIAGMYPAGILTVTLIGYLIGVPLATVGGAFLYKEDDEEPVAEQAPEPSFSAPEPAPPAPEPESAPPSYGSTEGSGERPPSNPPSYG